MPGSSDVRLRGWTHIGPVFVDAPASGQWEMGIGAPPPYLHQKLDVWPRRAGVAPGLTHVAAVILPSEALIEERGAGDEQIRWVSLPLPRTGIAFHMVLVAPDVSQVSKAVQSAEFGELVGSIRLANGETAVVAVERVQESPPRTWWWRIYQRARDELARISAEADRHNYPVLELLFGTAPDGARFMLDIELPPLTALEVPTKGSGRFRCPCCQHITFREAPPGTWETCPVCAWTDDRVQYDDPSYRGGANKESLSEARASFARIGASHERMLPYVRPPRSDEIPP